MKCGDEAQPQPQPACVISIHTALVAVESRHTYALSAVVSIHTLPTAYPLPESSVAVGATVAFKFDCLIAISSIPRFVLAPLAVVEPVPPFARAIVVPFHVPVVIVPRVVIFEEPAHVESAVFSTFHSHTSLLVRTTAHVLPATLNTASV